MEEALPNRGPKRVSNPLTNSGPATTNRRRRRVRPAGWEDHVGACEHCKQGRMRRAHRESVFEFLLSCFGFFPFVCKSCFQRTLRSHRLHTLIAVTVFLLLVGSSVAILNDVWQYRDHELGAVALQLRAADGDSGTSVSSGVEIPSFLTNEDITHLTRSGLSSQFIVKLIRREGHQFRVDAESLAEIKRSGAAEEVIEAMVDVTLAKTRNAPPETTTAAAPSTTHP